MSGEYSDGSEWYVVRTHPGQEDRAASNLSSLGIETLAPRLKTRAASRFTGFPVTTIKPLFPSYIFGRMRLPEMLHKVRYTRGVHSLVSFGNCPAQIEFEIIQSIRARVAADGFVRLGDDFKPGDRVLVKDGALRSFTAIFEEETHDIERVRILLQTVSYQVHAVIERANLTKLNESIPA
jgi:transcription elongation factor/antiterminator RfaH